MLSRRILKMATSHEIGCDHMTGGSRVMRIFPKFFLLLELSSFSRWKMHLWNQSIYLIKLQIKYITFLNLGKLLVYYILLHNWFSLLPWVSGHELPVGYHSPCLSKTTTPCTPWCLSRLLYRTAWSNQGRHCNGSLARYVKLRVVHAPGIPGTLSPPLCVSDPNMRHGTSVTHVPWCMPGSLTCGFLWWWGKRSRNSRRMRNRDYSWETCTSMWWDS